MPNTFHGQQRDAIVRHLVNKWLPNGPAVSILQGFPGCGKSQLAVSVAEKAAKSLAPIKPPADAADPVLDVLIDLALALDATGIHGLLQAIEKGIQTSMQSLGKLLLDILKQHQILIVIDEFQRLLPKNSTLPPAPWAELVEQLNNSASPRGRLLLISNRSIKVERWCESCDIEELRGLHDKEAEAFFAELLEEKGLADKVPQNQRRAIVHRLSGNPRALKTLVYALRTDSLKDLFPNAPDLNQMGDVVLDPRLLEEFERELLERALPKLEANLLKFMRWLSVHRIPFQKEALAQFTGGQETPEALRQQLFERFLLDQVPGGDVPHQLAREISVSRLRPDKGEWVQAHNLAANYHMRRFEARQLSGGSTLPASYAELRHHLYEAGRIDELHKASERLTKYAISQIGLVTPVPANKELLEERIALLSVIPADQRPRVLDYHLALCLKRRASAGDLEKALKHAREATGPHMATDVWLLRMNLEHTLYGIDSALPVLNDSLRYVPSESASPLYQRGSEMLAENNRPEDAITLLERGIAQTPANQSLYIYQSAIAISWIAGWFSKAEAFLVEGLTNVPKESNRNRIAELGIRLFGGRGDSEGLNRLLNLTGSARLDPPQLAHIECQMARIVSGWTAALKVAQMKRANFSNYSVLRTLEADAWIALGKLKEADDLMRDYRLNENQLRDSPVVWQKAFLSLLSGRPDEAKTLAALFAPNDFDSTKPMDEAEMLRLWSAARDGMNGPVELNFPGIAEYCQRKAAQVSTPETILVGETTKQQSVLAVATEWDSKHGGLSTFNRDLCAALAAAGARVICYVPQASSAEVERAKGVQVALVEALQMPGADGVALLIQRPTLPAGFVPDIVIGHDRITGAASIALARDHYSTSKRVLFIHTSPEEIEWHKEPREDSTSAERAEARKREQLGLATGCALVVAVGPHLASEFGTDLHGAGNRVAVLELTPGLLEPPANQASSFPPAIRCLILGRVEDYQLKGLDLAAKALGKVVANWKQGNAPKLVVRGAPLGTDEALRERLSKDSAPTTLEIVVRHYSADETEIRKDLREASLVLMPSRKEGFGLVGLEAIACGVPTLISASSGLAETVKFHAPQLANEWILPVTGDAVTKWAERIEFLLTGREGAFARADALRKQLAGKLDWRRAAAELLQKIALPKT